MGVIKGLQGRPEEGRLEISLFHVLVPSLGNQSGNEALGVIEGLQGHPEEGRLEKS